MMKSSPLSDEAVPPALPQRRGGQPARERPRLRRAQPGRQSSARRRRETRLERALWTVHALAQPAEGLASRTKTPGSIAPGAAMLVNQLTAQKSLRVIALCREALGRAGSLHDRPLV